MHPLALLPLAEGTQSPWLLPECDRHQLVVLLAVGVDDQVAAVLGEVYVHIVLCALLAIDQFLLPRLQVLPPHFMRPEVCRQFGEEYGLVPIEHYVLGFAQHVVLPALDAHDAVPLHVLDHEGGPLVVEQVEPECQVAVRGAEDGLRELDGVVVLPQELVLHDVQDLLLLRVPHPAPEDLRVLSAFVPSGHRPVLVLVIGFGSRLVPDVLPLGHSFVVVLTSVAPSLAHLLVVLFLLLHELLHFAGVLEACVIFIHPHPAMMPGQLGWVELPHVVLNSEGLRRSEEEGGCESAGLVHHPTIIILIYSINPS